MEKTIRYYGKTFTITQEELERALKGEPVNEIVDSIAEIYKEYNSLHVRVYKDAQIILEDLKHWFVRGIKNRKAVFILIRYDCKSMFFLPGDVKVIGVFNSKELAKAKIPGVLWKGDSATSKDDDRIHYEIEKFVTSTKNADFSCLIED